MNSNHGRVTTEREIAENRVYAAVNQAGGGGGGVTDHGALTGLSDDDHTQYAMAEGSGTRRAYEAGRLNRTVTAGVGLSGGVVRSGHWQEYGYTQEEWQALPLSERLRIRGIA